MAHIPVLLQPTIEQLNLQAGEILVDGTLGHGGHAKVLGTALGSNGLLIGLDADSQALKIAKNELTDCQTPTKLVQGNFRHLGDILDKIKVKKIDALLLDLGFNSDQLASSGRGFSFFKNEPLLMTLADDDTIANLVTAAEAVNDWSEESLADIIYGFGQEQFSRRIAKAIVTARGQKQIETTGELVKIIEGAVPAWYCHRKIHPATKTFQALRIAVNDELGALKAVLPQAWARLNIGGRLAVISFHSLEARIVKDWMKAKVAEGEGELVTKKVVKPNRAEELANPRARSAQLRTIRKFKM